MNHEIIEQEFNGTDELHGGLLCRIYEVPTGRVTFTREGVDGFRIHLSFNLTKKQRDIMSEELSYVSGISTLNVYATTIDVHYSILFNYVELKYRTLLAIEIACEKIKC